MISFTIFMLVIFLWNHYFCSQYSSIKGCKYTKLRRVRTFLLVCFLTALTSSSFAQNLYPIPNTIVTTNIDGLVFTNEAKSLTYVNGLGWLTPDLNISLIQQNNTVYAPIELFEVLNLNTQRLSAVRYGGSDKQRIVLDVANIPPSLLPLSKQEDFIPEDQVLTLSLPSLLLPLELNSKTLSFESTASSTFLSLETDALRYEFFALENPQRLVIDLFSKPEIETVKVPITPNIPEPQENVLPSYSVLRPGVIYQRIEQTSQSPIHILEMQQGSGEFRVVGRQQQGSPLNDLADGAYAAINAGYFDPRTFQSIGFLKVDHGLLSLPSRNRASIALNPNSSAVQLDRVQATLELYKADQQIHQHNLAQTGYISLHANENAWVGNARVGVLTVSNGVVLSNTLGPKQVPTNGYALVYAPNIRELALLNIGDPLRYTLKLEPSYFETTPYSVEAGPLLLKDGQTVFNPQLEQFQEGVRILDAVTQQAAIATNDAGSTFFIVAERMSAKDLIRFLEEGNFKDAMRLDSGSSSTLFIDGDIVNRRFARPISSAIVFIPNLP